MIETKSDTLLVALAFAHGLTYASNHEIHTNEKEKKNTAITVVSTNESAAL